LWRRRDARLGLGCSLLCPSRLLPRALRLDARLAQLLSGVAKFDLEALQFTLKLTDLALDRVDPVGG
jgi:hypothetical protein